jgi:hypothetical protein
MTKTRFYAAAAILALNSGVVLAQSSEDELTAHSRHATDWSRYSFDYSNSNYNPFVTAISRRTAPLLEWGEGDTAFSHRDAVWSEVIVGVDPDPANAPKITEWAKGITMPCIRSAPEAPI